MSTTKKTLIWVVSALLSVGLCAESMAGDGTKNSGKRSNGKSTRGASRRTARRATRRVTRRKAVVKGRKGSASRGGANKGEASTDSATAGEGSGEQKRKSRFGRRRSTQTGRIKAGVEDGSLTKREAGRLIGQQKRVGKMAEDMKSDGKVTFGERIKLERAQDKASRSIFRQRHDEQGEMGPKPDYEQWSPGVNKRQRNQKFRVGQGIRSGSLTKEEAQGIIGKERELAKLEKDYKSDGKLTKDERKELHSQLDGLSKEIYEEKHDDETGPGRRPRRPKINKKLKEKIDSGEITGEEAKELCKQMRRVHYLRRKLKGTTLTGEDREAAEEELNGLVANLHEGEDEAAE